MSAVERRRVIRTRIVTTLRAASIASVTPAWRALASTTTASVTYLSLVLSHLCLCTAWRLLKVKYIQTDFTGTRTASLFFSLFQFFSSSQLSFFLPF